MDNNSGSSKSKASLICGIVSLLIVPRIFGIVAVVLGIMGLSSEDSKKSAAFGLCLGIFSFLYSFFAQGTINWF